MSAWLIYIWTRLDALVGVSCAISAIGAVICFLVTLGYCMEKTSYSPDDKSLALFKKGMRVLFPTVIIFMLMGVFIPTKKDAAMIYVIPKMAQSETFNAISKETPEITKLALEALKETLQGMTKEDKQ